MGDSESSNRDKPLRRFFELSLDLMCVAGMDGYFRRVNPRFMEVLGYTEAELLEKPFTDFIHPDDVEPTLSEIKRQSEAQLTIDFENRYRCKDGSYRWFSWRAVPSVDEQVMYATARDLTDTKQAELQREILVRIVEATQDGIISADAEGKILTWNKGATTISGRTAEEAIGQSIAFFTPAERMDEAMQVLTTVLEGQAIKQHETQCLYRDGSLIDVSLTVSPIMESGKVTGMGLVIRDITHKKEVERTKNEFVSVVSHELRTPLTSIRGSLGLIEGGKVGELNPKLAQLVKIARTNTDRLIRLINDILDLEKIEAGRLELLEEKIKPAELVQTALAAVQGMADEGSVKLDHHITLDASKHHILADKDRLTQLLVNLLSNAIKFSPKSGLVTVTAESTPDDQLRFSVKDEGAGIAEDQQARIFGRFQQADGSDTRTKGGTGLGLAISKAIAEEHGGHIGVTSAPGEGSCFWFEMPSTRRRKRDSVDVETYVLIVEDDADLATVLREQLESEGYTVEHAADVASAMEAIQRGVPDAVLLDLNLPDGDGTTVLRRLRDHSRTQDVPVIIMTGSARRGEVDIGGATLVDWVSKPFDHTRMMRTLKRSLRNTDNPTVLIVDDDRDTRTVLTAMFEDQGIEVLSAGDGQTGVQLARQSLPDLIVLDVGMQGLNGFDVVSLLRHGPTKTIPLIVYTGRELNDTDREALRLGITEYLTKSRASEDQLQRTVGRLLNGLLQD